MSYLCQDCKSNNNGWCSVKKCNGLKKLNISYCNRYESNNTQVRGKRSELKPLDDYADLKKDDSEAHRVLGKRQMLWNIQRQVVAINQDVPESERYDALVECLKSFAKMQDIEESIYNVDSILESVIDSDIIEQSKYINTII